MVTENDFADPKMWGEHYRQFSTGTVGTGVAIGDYDGDGKPDIFVVSKTGACRLFRNLGNWKFEDVTDKAGLGAGAGWIATAKNWAGLGGDAAADSPERWKQGAVFADVNNDGRLDLYVCRFNAPNWLFINQGDGTFKEEAAARGLAVVDACGVGAFCDYDRDGWLDVFVTTSMLDAAERPNGGRGHLFRNQGDGTFTDVTARAGIMGETLSHSATWWDFDEDGWPDLYVANDFAGADLLYRNRRDGTFEEVVDRVIPHQPYSSMGADLGDVDNDGRLDLFVGDMAASTHEKDQRGMAYSRSLGNTSSPQARGVPQYSHNTLYLATGTPRCREAAYLSGLDATDWTWAPRFEDLDNDGRLDLFVTTGMTREFQNADLLDRSVRAENSTERIGIMRTSPKLMEPNLAYRNLGDLRFEEVGAAWGLNQHGVSFGAALGDLDGDGDLDIVFANYQSGVTVLRNDSDSGHRLIVALHGTRSNRFGAGATVRIETVSGLQVRQLVIARGYLSSSEPVLHFGLGDDTRVTRLTVAWPSGAEQSFRDLAVDRRYAITEPAAVAPLQERRYDPATAQFQPVGAVPNLGLLSVDDDLVSEDLIHEGRGPAVALGDLDGDGRDDLVLGKAGSEPLRIVLKGHVQRLVTDGDHDGPIAIFDADGDGAKDLLVTSRNLAAPQLFLNDGRGTLRAAQGGVLPRIEINAGAVAAVDFDRDGHLDVFIGARELPGQNPLPPNSVLLRNAGASKSPRDAGSANPWLEDVTAAVAPGLQKVGLVTAALWSDVDNDGWPDLLVACEWGPVSYFHNDHGKRFEDWTEKAGFSAGGTGWWTALATADFNGDGRPDFVTGNIGLNTQYRADAAHPALLFLGDFVGRGRPQLIEAYYEGDKLYPWRTRKELGAQIPSVLKRYTRNDTYARAVLPEIVGADKLAAARTFRATEFRSGIFLSQADGTYRFEPLPRIAQISPLVSLVTVDFNGDGFADIYAVQNSPAPSGGLERFDGGLSQLLLGDGHGHFTPVAPAESGLIVPGTANTVAVIDFDDDGWPDVVVARGNGKIRAFHNNGVPGRSPSGTTLKAGLAP
ncbi:MAG: VCBS repeat-containing protein [Pyrinomonadaceae bacterium]